MTLIRPLKKGFKQMIAEANAAIETISVHDAMALVGDDLVLFLDVREDQELSAGFAPGAMHVPRGFLEFYADPELPMHKSEFARADRIVVYCASGGRCPRWRVPSLTWVLARSSILPAAWRPGKPPTAP